MTKTEIRSILKSGVKTGWYHFKDKTDKDYILDLLKDSDLADVFSALESCELEYKEDYDSIQELREEFEGLD